MQAVLKVFSWLLTLLKPDPDPQHWFNKLLCQQIELGMHYQKKVTALHQVFLINVLYTNNIVHVIYLAYQLGAPKSEAL
jgi:hypothetical protein